MADSPKGDIDGVPLLGSGPCTWTFKEGLQPSVETFDVGRKGRAILLEKGKAGQAVTLTLHTAREKPVIVKKLYIIPSPPGPDPFVTRVRLADSRYWWKYWNISRNYNMRRRIGVFRVEQYGVAEMASTPPLIWYYPWSLKNPNSGAAGKWTAKEVAEDIFRVIQQQQAAYSKVSANLLLDLDAVHGDLPVENLEIDDTADIAVGRLMGYLPEGAITINEDGDIRLFSRANGGDAVLVKNLGPQIVKSGRIEFVDHSIIRPREIHVLYTPEVEIRCDGEEPATYTSDFTNGILKSLNIPAGSEEPILENVLPLPDFRTTMEDGREVAEGTWVTFSQAFKAWGKHPILGQMDYDILRRAMNPQSDFWGKLGILGKLDPDQSRSWIARVQTMRRHYRTSWRLHPRVRDRIWKIEASRIGTIDTVSGERAASTVYANWTLICGQKMFVKQHQNALAKGEVLSPGEMTYASLVRGYPESGKLNDTTYPMPCKVRMLDPDLGIIHFDINLREERGAEGALPGWLEAGTVPTADISSPGNRPLTFNSRLRNGRMPQMEPGWKIIVILTVIPGAPNTNERLFRVVVKPKDVEGMLPGSMKAGLGEAHGPIMEVRVGPSMETARVRYADSAAGRIKALLGLGKPAAMPDISDLVLNLGSNSDNAASLNAIAKAFAARVYASMSDRHMGTASGIMAPGAIPSGWASQVQQIIDTQGVCTTLLTLPDQVPKMSALGLMDSSSRAVLLRIPQYR